MCKNNLTLESVLSVVEQLKSMNKGADCIRYEPFMAVNDISMLKDPDKNTLYYGMFTTGREEVIMMDRGAGLTVGINSQIIELFSHVETFPYDESDCKFRGWMIKGEGINDFDYGGGPS